MSGYDAVILADGPTFFWPFNEASGTTATDIADSNQGTYSGATLGQTGIGDGETAVLLSGSSSAVTTAVALPNPGPQPPFTLEIWFNVANGYGSGGGLFMFSAARLGVPSKVSVAVWLDNSGSLHYGELVQAGTGVQTIVSGTTYNDGNWHVVHAVTTSTGSLRLYVDGALVGSLSTVSQPYASAGYWRIGQANLSSSTWPSGVPASVSIAGTLAKAAIYPVALSSTQIAAHYNAAASASQGAAGAQFPPVQRTPGLYPGLFSGQPLVGVPTAGPTPPPPPLLPLVTVLPATGITSSSANLIGSINPQGFAGTCWFVWGTSTLFGHTTATQTVAANSLPQTFTATLTGLTTGTTYWFAFVGSTSAGTVTSFPLSFVPEAPQPVVNPLNPVVRPGAPLVNIPHFQWPFTVDPNFGVAVVEQDTPDEIWTCVRVLCACLQGQCPELPDLGIPDLTFHQSPTNAASVISALNVQEPRADAVQIGNTLADIEQIPGTIVGDGSSLLGSNFQLASPQIEAGQDEVEIEVEGV